MRVWADEEQKLGQIQSPLGLLLSGPCARYKGIYMAQQCEAVVVTCIDFRFQKFFDPWLHERLRHGNYDRIGIAGGVKSWETVFSQIQISKDLHGVKKVLLVNHEDCGAYGEAGTVHRHEVDLREAMAKVREKFPDVDVELYYARLSGSFDAIE
jgi:carbonic anhydrase